ncbi:TetR/AcrR family transcriptional regulator [Micromonospora sp. NPDC003197]
MIDEPGRRERKKQRTRQALIDAAVELFERKGYEETTVAEIAAAADLSTRTFFLHFPTKEDVLLVNAQTRFDLALRIISAPLAGETGTELLARAMQEMITNSWNTDLPSGLAALRARLLTSVPELRARLLHHLHTGQEEMADALHRTYPEQLDRVDAAALVGAALGAVNAAALTSIRQGDTAETVRAAMRRAVDLAVRGFEVANPGT